MAHHRSPKDYTEEQQEQFMREFAAERRRQIIVAIGFAPFLVLLVAGSRRWGEDPLIQLPFVLVVLGFAAVVGLLVFSRKNWRCPACGKYLGRSIGVCECPGCGITLRMPARNPSGSSAGHTEEQEKQFKRQFAARQRRQRVAATSAVVAVPLGVIASVGSGVSPIRLFVILAAGVFVLGVLVFSFVNWRCPACGRYLGQIPIRRHCPKCGVALR
jgi:Zn finger protein HypA/HybF involved in hydrogenase expression